MKDWLSLWLANYEEPEPLTLSSYGNLNPESGCRENDIKPCQSLLPSGFREVKTLGTCFNEWTLCGIFFYRVKHCHLKKKISFQKTLIFHNDFFHSAGSFPGKYFVLISLHPKKGDNVFRILKGMCDPSFMWQMFIGHPWVLDKVAGKKDSEMYDSCSKHGLKSPAAWVQILLQPLVAVWGCAGYTAFLCCDFPNHKTGMSTMLVCVLSRFRLFVTPWTVAHQAPLSMGFSRQKYQSRLPCPPPNPEIKPTSPALQADSLPTESPGKPPIMPTSL